MDNDSLPFVPKSFIIRACRAASSINKEPAGLDIAKEKDPEASQPDHSFANTFASGRGKKCIPFPCSVFDSCERTNSEVWSICTHTFTVYYMHGSYGHDRISGKTERNRGRESRMEEAGTRVCDSTRDKDVAHREPIPWNGNLESRSIAAAANLLYVAEALL